MPDTVAPEETSARPHIDALAHQAEGLFGTDNFEEAVQIFERIVEVSSPGTRAGHFYQAYGLEHLGWCEVELAKQASPEPIDAVRTEWGNARDNTFAAAMGHLHDAESTYADADYPIHAAAVTCRRGVLHLEWEDDAENAIEEIQGSIDALSGWAEKTDDQALVDEHLGNALARMAEAVAARGWGRDAVLARMYVRAAAEIPQRNPAFAKEIKRIASELGVELPGQV